MKAWTSLVLQLLHNRCERAATSAEWQDLVDRVYNPKDEVTIGIVGKYVEYEDSYKSLERGAGPRRARAQPQAQRSSGSKPKA